MGSDLETLKDLIRQALALSDGMGRLVVGARLSEALAALDRDDSSTGDEDSVGDPMRDQAGDGRMPDGGDL